MEKAATGDKEQRANLSRSRESSMGIIKNITFSDGGKIDLDDDSIVVLVGPNNAGKSQALRDVYGLCLDRRSGSRVIKDIQLSLPPQAELERDISRYSKIDNQGTYTKIEGPGYSFTTYQVSRLYGVRSEEEALGDIRAFLIALLDTENRLGLVYPPQAIETNGKKEHPIHYLADSEEYQSRISDVFQRAFGQPLSVDILNGCTVPLRIGSLPDLESFHANSAMEAITQAKKEMATYDEMQDQGDGMRSFVGIILHLLIKHRLAYIIDEPESFLHPPQAYILGQIIGELLGENRQCILATHSRDVIRGLIASNPERVKVIRVTRSGNINPIRVLDSEAIKELWSDPILKYSNIMDAMFHESVALCESDSDCMMYSLVRSYLSEQDGRISQTQFIHCGGKARMAKVVDALQSLGIEFRVIADLDLLNNQQTCKRLFESCGGCWAEIEQDYRIASSSITQNTQRVSKATLIEALENCSGPHLKKDDIKDLQNLLNTGKPWNAVKQHGFKAFPGGEASNAAKRLDECFRRNGIFLVPVGELEMFNKASGKHGPAWVSDILEAYPDFSDPSYSEIKAFVSSWRL